MKPGKVSGKKRK